VGFYMVCMCVALNIYNYYVWGVKGSVGLYVKLMPALSMPSSLECVARGVWRHSL